MNIPTVETTNQSRFRNSFELNWINSHFIETKKQNIKKTECFYDSSQIFSRPCLIFYLVFSFSGIAGYIPLQHHKTSLNKTFMYLRPLFSGDVEPTTPISTNTHPKSSPFCTKKLSPKDLTRLLQGTISFVILKSTQRRFEWDTVGSLTDLKIWPFDFKDMLKGKSWNILVLWELPMP